MPLVSLDHIRMAYGHLPLLDDASLLIEAGERVCVIGRNGTGKSTLLQIIGGDVIPDAGTVWRQPGLRIARLEQDVPLSTERRVREVVADGFNELAARRSLARRRQRRHGDLPARASGRRDRVDAVRRLAAPRAARARARRAARCAAARRADQPSRHRGDDLARVVPRRLPRRRRLRHARPRVSAARRHAHRRARSRPAHVLARRLRRRSSKRRRPGSRTKRSSTRSSTRSSRRKRRGCARASRPGARATRGACAR